MSNRTRELNVYLIADLVLILILLISCAGFFFLGRWYERTTTTIQVEEVFAHPQLMENW
jgi:hypothetical protein